MKEGFDIQAMAFKEVAQVIMEAGKFKIYS
jgi:hypothetical protein